MDLAGVDRDAPIQKAEFVTKHLSDVSFRNQRALQERTTYALSTVAGLRGGLEPDILEDAYWWQTRDFVQSAVLAAAAYVRACAERQRQPLERFIDDLLTALKLPYASTRAPQE